MSETGEAGPVPPLIIDGHWAFDYTYYAGDAASRFFAGLARRQILGSRCPQCQRVLVPARGFCDACFTETTDWIEVSPHGTLETFTILTTSFPGLPEPPLVVGYVRLDGATSAVLNFVEGIDLADPDQAGAGLLRQPRVTARFKDICEGRITDFTFTLDEPGVTADLAIAGVGQTAYRRRHQGSTPELVHTAVRAALDHAGLTHRDIDVVVGGFAPDALAGENCPDKRFLPAAGAVGKWSLRVNTGGTTGIAAAYAAMDLLEAGHGAAALVVAVERMAQARSVPAVFNSIFDPIYERDTGLSTVSMGALRASRMMQRWGYNAQVWAQVAERNFAHAAANPLAQIRTPYTVADVLASRLLAWPIRQLDACPISEGVCAIVLTRGSPGSGRPAAYVRGRATMTDTYSMGDRIGRPEGDLVELLTLRRAARGALEQAGLSSAAEADVVEIHAPFDHAETMAYAPLGFCAAEDGPALIETGFGHRDGSGPVINPSGGPQAANPVGATALVRLAECALQVTGDAGDHQVPGAATAVATGQGGSTQFSTCTVLSGS